MVRRGAFELYPRTLRAVGDLAYVDNIHRVQVDNSEDSVPKLHLMERTLSENVADGANSAEGGDAIVLSLFNFDLTRTDLLAINTLLNVLAFVLSVVTLIVSSKRTHI